VERSDATHVAVGGTFLGSGLVTTGILVPLAAAAKPHPWHAAWFLVPSSIAGGIGLLGFYMLIAVYTGWPLPRTHSEREAAPRLTAENAYVVRAYGRVVIFQVGFKNEGRGDLDAATVNVLVPNFAIALARCDSSGNSIDSRGRAEPTSESVTVDEHGKPLPSVFWDERLDFPGRVSRPIYFRVTLAGDQAELPVVVKVTAPPLDDFERRYVLTVPPASV
jgi:hypothetical protein